jgi:hypothetical protein
MFFMQLISAGNKDTKYLTNRFDLQGSGKVSAGNTKYAEHYIPYGYSFRIYGYCAEIVK